MVRLTKQKYILTALGVILLYFIIGFSHHSEFFNFIESQTISWRFWVRENIFGKSLFPSQEIIIVSIDDQTIQKMSHPFPRSELAKVIEILKADGAKVIGIDIIMNYKDPFGEEHDKKLAKVIKGDNVILPSILKFSNGDFQDITEPIPILRDKAFSGFINILSHPSLSRIGLVFPKSEDSFYYSFPLMILTKYYNMNTEAIKVKNGKEIKIGAMKIPVDRENLFWIDYTSASFAKEPFERVLDRRFPKGRFKDKIVLIGKMFPEAKDYFWTPLGMKYGIEIYANCLNNMIKGEFITSLGRLANWIILLILTLIATWTTTHLKAFKAIFVLLFEIIIFFLFVSYLFCGHKYLAETTFPLICIFSYLLVIKGREIAKLQKGIQKNILHKVKGKLYPLSLKGERKELTILFCDIRGFTKFSKNVEAEEVVIILNEYFDEMAKIITKKEYDGSIDKFIGDGILVFFGDPVSYEDHAKRAVLTAVDMCDKFKELQNKWITEGRNIGVEKEKINIGIGINTGFVTVGNVGSKAIELMDYTVIGNEVNLASRIGGVAERGQILITERTYALVKDYVDVKKLDNQSELKGIDKEVWLYEVKGRKNL